MSRLLFLSFYKYTRRCDKLNFKSLFVKHNHSLSFTTMLNFLLRQGERALKCSWGVGCGHFGRPDWGLGVGH
jgi:hypothetical protein